MFPPAPLYQAWQRAWSWHCHHLHKTAWLFFSDDSWANKVWENWLSPITLNCSFWIRCILLQSTFWNTEFIEFNRSLVLNIQKGLQWDAQLIHLGFDNLQIIDITYTSKTFSKGIKGQEPFSSFRDGSIILACALFKVICMSLIP